MFVKSSLDGRLAVFIQLFSMQSANITSLGGENVSELVLPVISHPESDWNISRKRDKRF